MGRNAHVLRLALGRNADQAPDWPTLSDQYTASDREIDEETHTYHGIDHASHMTFERLFSEKGQPISLDARDLDRARCEAQNAVVSIALPPTETFDQAIRSETAFGLIDRPYWTAVAQVMQTFDHLFVSWLVSFRDRLSMLRSLNRDPSLAQAFALELHTLGVFETFTAGYLCCLVEQSLPGDPRKDRPSLIGWLSLPRGQHRIGSSTLAKYCVSYSLQVVEAGFILAAHLQALHIGPVPTPENRFPWVNLIRSCHSQQLATFAAKVLLPAWFLCTLRLQARTFVRGILDQEFVHPCYTRNYPYYSSWTIPTNSEPRDARRGEVRDHALTTLDHSPVSSLAALYAKTRATGRAASSWLIDSLRWRPKPEVLILKKNGAQSLELLADLPLIFTANLVPELLQQVLLSPFNGVISRSMAWLFLAPGSPLREQLAYVSPDDLFPILPTLADFTPGLGLRATLNYMANVSLIFALQCGLSFALIGIKSAVALAVLKRDIKRISHKTNYQSASDRYGID